MRRCETACCTALDVELKASTKYESATVEWWSRCIVLRDARSAPRPLSASARCVLTMVLTPHPAGAPAGECTD
jgi:hypothetical protein